MNMTVAQTTRPIVYNALTLNTDSFHYIEPEECFTNNERYGMFHCLLSAHFSTILDKKGFTHDYLFKHIEIQLTSS